MHGWDTVTERFPRAVRSRLLTGLLVPPEGMGVGLCVRRATVQDAPGSSVFLTARLEPHATQGEARHLSSWSKMAETRKMNTREDSDEMRRSCRPRFSTPGATALFQVGLSHDGNPVPALKAPLAQGLRDRGSCARRACLPRPELHWGFSCHLSWSSHNLTRTRLERYVLIHR